MRINSLKARLAAGLPCRGVWLALASPNSARLLARLPIDWAVVDAEHTPMDEVTLYRMVTGITEAAGPAPVVRVAQLAVENIKRALDAGAYGVIAPMVNTRAEAEQAVAWSRFPPQGVRSYGSPFTGLAFDASGTEYLRQANEQTAGGRADRKRGRPGQPGRYLQHARPGPGLRRPGGPLHLARARAPAGEPPPALSGGHRRDPASRRGPPPAAGNVLLQRGGSRRAHPPGFPVRQRGQRRPD